MAIFLIFYALLNEKIKKFLVKDTLNMLSSLIGAILRIGTFI